MKYVRTRPTPEEMREHIDRIQEKYRFPMSAVEYTLLVRRELPDGQTVSDSTLRKYLAQTSRYRPLGEGERTVHMTGPDPRVFHLAEYLNEPRDVQLLNSLLGGAEETTETSLGETMVLELPVELAEALLEHLDRALVRR